MSTSKSSGGVRHALPGLENHPPGRRRDIDLLRAIAVLAVIFYHFDVPGVSGGFLGVDMFFVISGYLITLHIREQIQSSSFNFFYFYLRRIRRLFPALGATLLLSSIAALFILPTNLLEEYSESLIASSLYVSNIYFWSLADYFDSESIYKPLLHTWSLSVEEQFYIVWPLFITLFFRWRLNTAIIVAGLTSLLAALYLSASSATIFYQFPFRIFEFAIGAIIGRSSLGHSPDWARNILSIAALLAVGAAFAFLDQLAPTPSWGTFAVTLGTALIIAVRAPILNGDQAIIRPVLRIGLVSYSAYLVHWPLVVFYKIIVPGPLSPLESISLVLSTLLLAEAFYRLVEHPTSRVDLKKYRYRLIAILPAIVIFSITFNLAYPTLTRDEVATNITVESLLAGIPKSQEEIRSIAEAEIASQKTRAKPDRPIIAVLGDSHADNVALSLRLVMGEDNVDVQLINSICDPLSRHSISVSMQELYRNHSQELTRQTGYCEEAHDKFLSRITQAAPDLIIFSEAWRADALPYLSDTIEDIRSITPAKIIILGRVPQFVGIPPVIYRDLDSVDRINEVAWSRRYKIFDDFDERLSAIAKESDVHFISKRELVCPNYVCQIQIGDKIGYSDAHHWTPAGMKFYGNRLVSDPMFKAALGP